MSHYLIEFGPARSGEQVILGPDTLNSTGWRSIGNPDGVTFSNETNETITSLYIKTNYPEDRFVLNPDSLGGVFQRAWISSDGTEFLFVGADIPN